MGQEQKIEPIVYLLFGGILFFTVAIFTCEVFYKDDGSLFQVFSNMLAGFSGAFFMRVKPKDGTTDSKATAVAVANQPDTSKQIP